MFRLLVFPPRLKAWARMPRKEWKSIAPFLYEMGVLTVLDTEALVSYCECYAKWRRAERELRSHRRFYEVRV